MEPRGTQSWREKRWPAVLLAVLLLTLSVPSQGAQTSRDAMTIYPARRTHLIDQPLGKLKWDKNGYLIHYQRGAHPQPLIGLYTADGEVVSQLSPASHLTGVRRMTIKDVAVTKSGVLVVAAVVRSTNGALASALLEFDMKGVLRRVIKMDPFTPDRIALDADDNIWILGYDWQRLGKNDDWALVHKLSLDGRVLTSTLVRSAFPKEGDPLDVSGPGIGASDKYFESVGDKVYAWLPGGNHLVILALDGRVLRSVNRPFDGLFEKGAQFLEIHALVFLPGDRVVVQAANLGRGIVLGYGWFLSTDLGRTWSSVRHRFDDPWAYSLIGVTKSKEAIFLRLVGPDAGILESCPVAF
ncbi:hypothetical protein HRbin10_01609 [bacterium HR10]|uniref:Uncharacterized protein n=1 Tax=uncultured Acidobacteriota bacterium TaxID=171953 RepID=H5SIW8_9BACT|nr:hypothetical protein HGMM_F34F02C41 [uncultured Acidobacteriota bacterium]GBC82484.1 hypothetical protein HRbin10_01609 [bacterium HR10]